VPRSRRRPRDGFLQSGGLSRCACSQEENCISNGSPALHCIVSFIEDQLITTLLRTIARKSGSFGDLPATINCGANAKELNMLSAPRIVVPVSNRALLSQSDGGALIAASGTSNLQATPDGAKRQLPHKRQPVPGTDGVLLRGFGVRRWSGLWRSGASASWPRRRRLPCARSGNFATGLHRWANSRRRL
jgi:hypothetical protein